MRAYSSVNSSNKLRLLSCIVSSNVRCNSWEFGVCWKTNFGVKGVGYCGEVLGGVDGDSGSVKGLLDEWEVGLC